MLRVEPKLRPSLVFSVGGDVYSYCLFSAELTLILVGGVDSAEDEVDRESFIDYPLCQAACLRSISASRTSQN